MSGRHKNNHYHYAEKFEHRRRSAAGKRAFMPFKSVIISLVVLLMFGLVCTTFSVYVSDTEPTDAAEFSPIISEVRNMKASRDIAFTGANADLAETGYTCSGYYPIFDNTNTNWSASYFYAAVGNGNGFSPFEMTQIENTNLYGVTSGITFSDNPYRAFFFCADSEWGWNSTSNDTYSEKFQYMKNYTAVKSFTGNVGGMWYANGANSNKGTTLTWGYDGTNGYNRFNSIQQIHSYTSTTSDTNSAYSSSNDGGLITITSAYRLNGNASSTASTDTNDGMSGTDNNKADGKYMAAKTSTVTLSASANSGYRFVGWYNGNTQLSTNSTYSYTVTGAYEVRARFIKTYTVTVAKSPSNYSGNPTANSDTTSVTVDAGSTVSLAADKKTGVTFNGWTLSSGATYNSTTGGGSTSSETFTIIPTSSFTATASYTLQKPTSVSLSYPDAITANGTDSSAPTKAATSPSSGTLSYTYTIAPQSGTTADSGTYDVDASGNVTATTPGKYTVTMSVTTSNYNLTSAATTATATVTVKPIAVPVSDIVWTASDYTSGEGTSTVPFKTPVNRTKFKIESYIPAASRNANYTYNWTRTDGEYLDNNGTITIYAGSRTVTSENVYTVSDTATSGTATTDVIHNTVPAANTGYIYKIAVTTNQNGVSSDPTYVTIYYGVTADFLNVESFDFSSFNATDKIQEIYAEDNNITAIDATYDAGGTDTFNTMLWFSSNNIDFNKVAVWAPNTFRILTGMFANPEPADAYSALPNDTNHTVSALIESLPTVARNNVNLMQTTGPKWFRAYVDDYNNPRVDAVYPWLHTTVGTASTVGDRPIYYVDQALATDVNVNSRVMAFYLTEADNTVHYQTAQTVSSKSNTYRFYIPSDATYITFAHVADNNYLIPTVDTTNGVTLSYTNYASSVLKAWTPTIDLNSSANEGMTTYIADTPGSPSNGIYNYTNTANSGNMTTFG